MVRILTVKPVAVRRAMLEMKGSRFINRRIYFLSLGKIFRGRPVRFKFCPLFWCL